MGSWAETERFWIGRMRQKNVWYLKFRDSEIYIWCHILEFNLFRALVSWRELKGLGWILPSGRRLPHRRLQSLLSKLQSPPWFRSIDLGFDCWGLWLEFWMLGEFLLEFVGRDFRIMLGFVRLFRVGFNVEVMFYSYAGCFQFEFRRLLDINGSQMRCVTP